MPGGGHKGHATLLMPAYAVGRPYRVHPVHREPAVGVQEIRVQEQDQVSDREHARLGAGRAVGGELHDGVKYRRVPPAIDRGHEVLERSDVGFSRVVRETGREGVRPDDTTSTQGSEGPVVRLRRVAFRNYYGRPLAFPV